ncbi:AraC family transcriptional regulator [Paenibacillus lupini]|uniref:AraC family transcriptional regulator n=1 Tax=Paenibacillus lupini TaxID=1450204 RepID=UPI00141F64C8|nr:AraC family transcriptional regulator [Paenibacillus lupini]NIK25506.1 ABC-type Fe3+-hydroxamate transport system substrate-binding protein [Paenibacillus lupini]
MKNSRIERWDETTARQASLTNSGLWKSIPAVKENHVYTLDSKFNYDDPITLDRLLDEIVTIMKR